MPAASKVVKVDSPFQWLWGNEELADVSFSINCTDFKAPNQEQGVLIIKKNPCEQAGNLIADPLGSVDTDLEEEGKAHVVTMIKKPSAAAAIASVSRPKEYLLHSQIISSYSAFFRASLTTDVGMSQKDALKPTSSIKWHMKAEMPLQAADAAEAVLLSLYAQKIYDDDTSSNLLLEIMKVADMWQANTTAVAASKALCLRTTCFPLVEVYSLPEGLMTSSSFSDVIVTAKVLLLLKFGDAKGVVDSPPLLQQFLSLPHAALLTLLESTEMATDSEATVVLLFSAWCEGEQGKACSDEQLLQLHGEIRYSCLPSCYLTELCTSLKSPKLSHKQLMELWHFRHNTTTGCTIPSSELDGPDGWYLPCRPLSTSRASATIKLVLKKADLEELLGNIGNASSGASRKSAKVYLSGFLWSFKLMIQGGDLWWAVMVEAVSTLRAKKPQGASFKHGVRCQVSTCIESHLDLVFDDDIYRVVSDGRGDILCSSPSSSMQGVHPSSSNMEWWTQYMVNGCVNIVTVIKDVDGSSV